MVGDPAGIEQADRVQIRIVIAGEVRRDAGCGKILLIRGEFRLQPHGEVDLGHDAGAAGLCVALDFEVSAVWRELRAECADMAHLAGLTGLRCK